MVSRIFHKRIHTKVKLTSLNLECKNLISKMLVTDPRQRASLSEILSHPWMTKGFNTVPENYLPHREPLQLPLDPQIIDKMTGFDFGSTEFITRELTRVINSEDYQTAVRVNVRDQSVAAAGGERRRGVFDFYKRRSSITSRDALPNSSAEAVQFGSDPVNAFSPLLSIYYLVKEKQDRERLEANPGALSMPISPGEKPLKMPDLPAPEAAYTNSTTYEMPGEKATGGRSRPRSRTHGEDDETAKRTQLGTSNQGSPALLAPSTEQPNRRESTAAGIFRRLSTRRGRDSTKDRGDAQHPPQVQVRPPPDQNTTPRKSFSVRRSRNRDPTPPLHPGGSTPHQPDLLSPSDKRETHKPSSLDRSASVNSVDYRKRQPRRGVSEGHATLAALDPPLTSGSDRSSNSGQKSKASEPPPLEHQPTLNARKSTGRTKSLGHARRESIQARRARREEAHEAREANVPEETDQELMEDEKGGKGGSAETMKPVYLKGLFSVSTTSNKPLSYIRADIVRVLKQLGVEYTDIKGGFSCRHAPSIDLSRVSDTSPTTAEQHGMTPKHNRRISFGGFRGGDREELERTPQQLNRSSAPRRRTQDTSFTGSEESDDSVGRPGRDPEKTHAGETTTQVQSDLGSNMVLKFEIFIVKVPLFSLHGIQFKKVAGGTWQYKNMAQKILVALRL